MKRILLIANKNWEVEPILNALLNKIMRPKTLADPDVLNYPWHFAPGSAAPRAVWNSFKDTTIELWCIQDIVGTIWNSSSSQGKNEDIQRIFNYRAEKPDLVAALGTAGFGDDSVNNNGCVVVGSQVFIHNYHPAGSNPLSQWDDNRFESLITSRVDPALIDLLDSDTHKSIRKSLLKPFLNPSADIKVISDFKNVAVSVVNITDYKEYTDADNKAIERARAEDLTDPIASVETTHGIIRLHTQEPFIFISGITDREGHFDEDVNGKDPDGNVKTSAQNYTAAFNIGVYLSWMLPKLADKISKA